MVRLVPVALETDLPPRLPLLAARASRLPGACVLATSGGAGPSYVAIDPQERRTGLDPEPNLPLRAAGPLSAAPRWVGLLPYESRRGLERPGRGRLQEDRADPHVAEPIWLRYAAVACVTDRVTVVGDRHQDVRRLHAALREPAPFGEAAIGPPIDPEPDLTHAGRIEVALGHIRAGEIYQVNLARRIRMSVRGSAVAVWERLGARAPAPFGAAVDAGDVRVVSTSPELFLSLGADRRLVTRPIKGTRPRGRDAVEDARQARELEADPKERAELAMILDVERNDLGRVARTGTVRLARPPAVVTSGPVHHRAATISALLRRDVDRSELLEAMLPSGSVTGAPKVRAMEIIAELEAHRRGLYTGAIGFLRHNGGLMLSMAIRVLTIRDGEGHYFAGGGIVADSDPRREVAETGWKSVQVRASR